LKCDTGKTATPFQSNAQPTKEGQDLVTKVLATFETGIAVLPNAVHRPYTVGLAKDIFKLNL
jgi:hypothetical protein